MSNLISINKEQRLYVLSCGDGVSCLGFDVAENWRLDYLAWLGMPAGPEPAKGTAEAYQAYRIASTLVFMHYEETGERCPSKLTPLLVGMEGRRVEVTMPSGEIEKFFVGKSTGWVPIHLAIVKKGDDCGFPVYIPDGSKIRILN